MSNTPWKEIQLADKRAPAGDEARATSFPSPMLGAAWKQALSSADANPIGRRVLVSQHMGGVHEFLVPSTTPVPAQTYPEVGVWREVSVTHAELTPGCALDVRLVAAPSGHHEWYNLGAGAWESSGGHGTVRVTVDYANALGQTDSVSAEFPIAPSLEDDYAEPATAGQFWNALQFFSLPIMHPTLAVAQSPTQRTKWSEDTTITITVEHEGGARVIHTSVSERPFYHVRAHDDDTSSLPQWVTTSPPTDRPQVTDKDGATYGEPRFGTSRGFGAALRQGQNFGPMIASWTSYTEAAAEVDDTVPDAVQVTSTTPVGLSIGSSITAWDEDNPGYDIAGHYARRMPENASTRIDGAATMPVRARVWARFTAAGSNTGYVRFQTTDRSWVTVAVPQSTTWSEHTITGFVECNVAVDDPLPSLQDFAWVTGGTMEVRYWDAYMSDQQTHA